ncbi:YfhO family protein [Flavobacterium aciduliphilum]|uniref:Membrane protein YfhO n=1 Tax=Flavobacterium aciduliphilum TaxID=1101402 RepID=A0A328YKU5_9FLAO|nr:YfhO family protein [Flavobacterium aciduliphilum]RAR70756.1 membrane protein YfhO [Flavobacterium aciduliphilum]
MNQIKKLYPHIVALAGFILIALLYFYPVLQGKKIFQSDIVQYTAMAKEQNDFRAANHSEPYWTNSAFGGMPTYQLGAQYPNDFIGKIDDILRFLPRPADYLFLYFLGFYSLLLVLRVDVLKAFFGALAFGFSTYLIVILGVGHNAKAHAIAYMPLLIAGVLLVFRKRYIVGGLLTMFAVALEINANHFQMTYYLLFLLLIIGVYYSIKLIQKKETQALLKIATTFGVALLFAIGANATSLLATKEYTDYSTRGKSELKLDANGKKKTSDATLDRSYITEYSYGIAESFNLIAPRLFGGGNGEKLSNDSAVYDYMLKYGASEDEARQFTDSYAPTYWGDQPIVAAPAYIGAIVFFLSVLALYHDKRKIKYVFLMGALFSLVLSWGKNFPVLTDFFIDYIPLYDKFRAVSSIQVLLELCFPVLAVLGFQSFFTTRQEKQWDSLWKTAATTLGILVLLFFARNMFDFAGSLDGQIRQMFSQSQDKSFGIGFIDALKEDRKTMYSADLLRSGIFISLTFGTLFMFVRNKLKSTTAVILVGILMVSDLFFVDKNYVSSKDFVSAHEVDMPFEPSVSDQQILQDTTNYRVLEVDGNLSSARASYFHKSIGGYSAVKPRAMQELFDYQIANNNRQVLDMLNVKYLIQTDDKGQPVAVVNPGANGNAWFVSTIQKVTNADAEMKALNHLDTKHTAVINTSNQEKIATSFVKDSTATIRLMSYKPNHLVYQTNTKNEAFAVFSEMYYKNGWNAYIDGKSSPYVKVDYALRGMTVPSGSHKIEFKFEPQVVKTGSSITLVSSIGMLLLLIGGVYFERKKKA